ncbi:GTPase [Actinidia chinensis var. chinensis]|uniref:GTPase n=1 Tax=Actinidia chinensis var. chinensis TaxID=1590841 RepID=A0A2R6S2K8_ACTCC|nr:GTPase [Actinidia chinensis var. chinensis]
MELGLHLRLHLHHLSARSIDNRHSPIHCCSHSNFNSGADNPLLRRRFTFHHTHFHYKATPTSGRPKYTYRYRNPLAEGEGEYEDEDGEEEEATTSLDGDDEVDDDESSLSGFLSLSVKPDRNMALLDDYELEELDAIPDPNHRSGYVAVLGKPNVGKSTLSNQMIGQKLSIVTDKPQTTRHRILGLCSGQMYQMILYDTPGVIEKKMHKLDSMMMKNVRDAAINADCALVVVDACKAPQKIDDILEEGVGGHNDRIPLLLVLNKTDLIKPGEIAKKLEWYEKFTDVDEVIPVSAKYGQGVDDVKDWILSKLPFGPAYYPKDIASEHPERFFVAEIVREKIFMQYRNEVPYACQVNVVTYKSRPAAKDFIQVEIVVEKNTQKIILIGKEGKALKQLATAARLDIEDFLQKKVFLEIEVKIKENWRQDEGLLKHYGYGGQIRVV